MNLDVHISPQVKEVLSHYISEYVVYFFLLLFTWDNSVVHIIFLLRFQNSHNLSSFLLFFFLFDLPIK